MSVSEKYRALDGKDFKALFFQIDAWLDCLL